MPTALVRNVSIRCERCNKPIELRMDKALGEEGLMDPMRGTVNSTRRELATFFP